MVHTSILAATPSAQASMRRLSRLDKAAPAVFDGALHILLNKMLGDRKVLTKPILPSQSTRA